MAYHERNIEDEIATLAIRFHAGAFTENVLRASLYALRLRGYELDRTMVEILAGKGKL